MSKNYKKINAAIIIIGNEILSGRTEEKNIKFISSWSNEKIGITVKEVRIIPDIKHEICKSVLALSKKFDYVFTTGGIGPTHDDITASSIASAFKVKYEFNKKAYNILEKYYGKKNFNDGRKKMAKMPKSSKLILNPSSAAPGFMIKNVFCLPGVPSILNSMIENCKRYLKRGARTHSKTINSLTVESNISKEMSKIQNKYSKTVEIGSYPFFRLGRVGVSIVIRSTIKRDLEESYYELKKLLKNKNIKSFN